MLFLAIAVEIGGEADLRLYFLLAIAEVIVRNHRNHHTAFVTAGCLERAAIVVEFVFVLPAHAIATLALSGGVPVRKAEFLLAKAGKVRRKNHTAGVPCEVHRVKGGIVFRKIGVSSVAEDSLHEV